MIIDHDETQRSGVISLMRRGPIAELTKAENMAEKTLALPVIKMGGESEPKPEPAPIPPVPTPRDPNPREPLPPLDPRPIRFEVKPLSLGVGHVESGTKVAARVQSLKSHLGVLVWYGEHTGQFWVMDAKGLHPFENVTAMYRGMGWGRL